MKASEIRELGLEDIQAKAKELKQELFNFRFQHESGQLENSARLKATRKEIARTCTIIRERQNQSN